MGCCKQRASFGAIYRASEEDPHFYCDSWSASTNPFNKKSSLASSTVGGRSASLPRAIDSSFYIKFGIVDLSSAVSLLCSKEPVTDKSIGVPYKFLSVPKSVGSLAMMYLCQKSSEISDSFERIFEENSYLLVECIKSSSLDLQEYTLLFITSALNMPNKQIKQALLKAKAIEACLSLTKSSHQHLRILAIEACAGIYKEFEDGQRVFLRNKGEWQLVQLIKRDGDDERVFTILLEIVFDLIYVISNQDEEGIMIVSNLKQVENAHLMDIIMSMDITSKSPQTIEAVDNLLQIYPFIDEGNE